jgi:cysteine synthase
MSIKSSVIEAIGNTPLIKLRRASDLSGCTILGKAEFMNPGQSVKDRPSRQMVLAAEERGELKPGGVIVEGTAGNTGIGLALVAKARGYRVVIVMPDTQSQEKKDALRLAGALLIEVPARPYSDKNNYQHVAKRLADTMRKSEPNGVLFADQWNNPENPRAHYLTTGPEIWADTDGKIDILVSGVGTGGTLTGVGEVIKERKPSFKVVAVEPLDSPVISGGAPGPHKIQGIGAGFVPDVLNTGIIDEVFKVRNEEAFATGLQLAKEEGLLVGISSGAAAFAALQIAKRPENKGKLIVAILPDTGERYLSTALFSD